MLLSHRKATLEHLGASVETHAVVHTAYRLHVVRNARVVCDDALFFRAFDRKGALGRPVVTVVLAGRARLRAFGRERWLERGDIAVIQAKSAVEMRQEGERFESVAFEYDPRAFGVSSATGFADGRISRAELARVESAANRLVEADGDERAAARQLEEMLSVLGAAGLPVRPLPASDLLEPVPSQTARLSHALDRALSSMDACPMIVDLDEALGLSARQVNRLVAEFNRRYGFNSVGWRDTRNRRRLMIGGTLLTAPGATTERIAHAVGYRAAPALCHAFAEAGLPSPGTIAANVAALG